MEVSSVIDKKIIQLTQAGLAIEKQPFKLLAKQLELTEEEVIARLKVLKEKGLIRRIGIVPNHYAIGYVYNLMTVWDINDDKIDYVGEKVGNLEFVSHCYQRPRHLPDWPYNFYAMVHGKNNNEVEIKMQHIKELVGDSCKQFTALKSTKILKKTGLRIK